MLIQGINYFHANFLPNLLNRFRVKTLIHSLLPHSQNYHLIKFNVILLFAKYLMYGIAV